MTGSPTIDEVQARGRLAAALRARGAGEARLLFVLGSGLGALAERLEHATAIPFDALEGMPTSGVPGHAGRVLLGELGGEPVAVQQGRVHLYEGWSTPTVTRSVRAFVAAGCRGVVLTNAAGGLRPEWPPGTLMRLSDHLDLQGRQALAAREAARGRVYDAALGLALEEGAERAGVELASGVYAGLLGPSYETPAEIRHLRRLGVDAVGMSTVAEAAAARAAGARVAAVSCITNHAAGVGAERLSHAEVVETGKRVAERFCALLETSVAPLTAALRE